MLVSHFLTFLIKSGLALTSGLVTLRAISTLISPPTQPTPVINLEEGAIQGKLGHSRNGSEYWQFLGIPYAEPPVRSLRFQPPLSVRKWRGVKQTLDWPAPCTQFESLVLGRPAGQEDCLYLNVFTNPRKTRNKKPVLVFIHGGGFFAGESSIYHAEYFMDYPIVLVTFNYRLGPLGFLNLEMENDPRHKFPRGNMGLKDQNLVLCWIQRNIASFGGDPGNVSLMGESAGAISSHLHTMTALSRNLFRRAILLSGSALSSWSFNHRPRKIAEEYARSLGCPSENASAIFRCFLEMDANKLVSAQWTWADPLREPLLFLPSIEPVTANDTFLRHSPQHLLSSGPPVSPVPLLFGVNSGEGGVRSARFSAMPELTPELDYNWNRLIGNVLLLEEPLPVDVAQELKRIYFGTKGRSLKDDDNQTDFIQNLTRLTSDALFYQPVHDSAAAHSRWAPTYMLWFDYKSIMLPGSYSFYRAVKSGEDQMSEGRLLQSLFTDWVKEHFLGEPGPHKMGVGHGEQLFQLFNVNGFSKWFSDGDLNFSREYVKSIVRFANGHAPRFRGQDWPPVTTGLIRSLPEMLVPYMVMDNSRKGWLTEEPFYLNRVQLLSRLRKKNFE